MSAKAARLKRRAKPSLRSRIRTYWILFVLVVGAAIYGGWSLATAPIFRLQTLDVVGLSRVAHADVVARAALDPRANIWLMNKAAVERRIEALPFVSSAHVHRALPGRVRIDVAERTPDGCVRAADAAYTIDRDQRVLAAGCTDPALPIYRVERAAGGANPGTFLHDTALAKLQADARALGADGRYVVYALDRFDQLEATLAAGIIVRFGDDADVASKDRLVGPILTQLGARAAQVKALDLRATTTPVVEFR